MGAREYSYLGYLLKNIDPEEYSRTEMNMIFAANLDKRLKSWRFNKDIFSSLINKTTDELDNILSGTCDIIGDKKLVGEIYQALYGFSLLGKRFFPIKITMKPNTPCPCNSGKKYKNCGCVKYHSKKNVFKIDDNTWQYDPKQIEKTESMSNELRKQLKEILEENGKI